MSLRSAFGVTTRGAASRTAAASTSAQGKFARRDSCATNGAQTARSFSSSPSTSAAPSFDTSSFVASRSPIPSEIRSNRPKPTRAVEQDDTVTTEAATEEDDGFVPPPLTNQNLSLLYSFTSPPPPSALSAFANRLARSSTTTPTSTSASLASDLPLIEQCLIHESFWSGVGNLPSPDSATHRFTNYHDSPLSSTSPLHAHNGSLATLGNALLGTLTSELLLASFPNLPTRVAKAALTMYAGPKILAAVAGSWGVGPSRLDRREVGREDQGKISRKERAYGHLVGGVGPARKVPSGLDGAAGAGLVRWNRQPTSPSQDAVLYEDALASVARAVIGAVYTTHGFAATRQFVHSHFLSRLVPRTSTSLAPPTASADLLPLLKFANPSRVLSLTLVKAGRQPSIHRLLKESGRLSSHATFVSGVFSGEEKLGEGFGSSIKMSEWRASEDALRRFYLGGERAKGLPSDAWAGVAKAFGGVSVGETEVHQESK